MKKYSTFILILIITFNYSCSSTTQIKSSWGEAEKEVAIGKLNKVLVVALFKNETSNRTAEDQMVKYLGGKGVVSYDYFNANFNRKDAAVIQDKIRADGFDGAVTMRLIDVDKEVTYVPGNISTYPRYFYSFSDYYFRSFNYYQTAGNYVNTKTYTVETNVYSIKENKIIWTGLTETTNPDGVEKMTAEIAKVIFNKMMKQGFISK